MTLNEVNIIKNSVLDATEAYVDARLSSSDFVKTQIGVTSGTPTKGSDGKYRHTVVCNKTAYTAGVTYTNVLSVGNVKFPNNSVVFLIAPNAQYSNQFILGKLDSSPANIVGGTIQIGEIAGTNPTEYYFNVNDTGNVTIKSGSIKLIKDNNFPNANWYHISLDTDGIKLGHQNVNSDKYNFSVDQNGNVKIYDGSILLGANGDGYNVDINNTGIGLGYNTSASGNHNFTVDTNGNLKIGNTSTPNFQVTSAGVVTIKSGSINIANKFYADSNGNLFVGGTTTSNSNFYVTNAGKVTIKSGSINIASKFYVDDTGNLFVGGTTTSSAKFYVTSAGYLKSTSGNIGGFNIGSEDLTIGDAKLSKNIIGCGVAGNGIVNLVGGNNNAYIQISDSGTPTSNLDGIRIYQDGHISSTLGTGWTTKYFKNIPDKEIYEDSSGYLKFRS